ncbi:uncharacterized protein Z518_03101 [Rhinocladiella mackenziei CBS 650.93]|uniref:Uncharacterized protein n=1 Tax=Rhinocladiella mackenziei CBS 650.93 TaxID=1442369 RepID=A0A0D2JGJ0_9EURO|nr:uncharacterized protein Z518_03101 [Rhinocladiella mackenziei CBS 650.93]KIX08445.1 hypothetical protein Z518_03101 [Rhinocladiella mackenziei CBS 650.93]
MENNLDPQQSVSGKPSDSTEHTRDVEVLGRRGHKKKWWNMNVVVNDESGCCTITTALLIKLGLNNKVVFPFDDGHNCEHKTLGRTRLFLSCGSGTEPTPFCILRSDKIAAVMTGHEKVWKQPSIRGYESSIAPVVFDPMTKEQEEEQRQIDAEEDARALRELAALVEKERASFRELIQSQTSQGQQGEQRANQQDEQHTSQRVEQHTNQQNLQQNHRA